MRKLFYSLLFLGIASATYAQSDSKPPIDPRAQRTVHVVQDQKVIIPETRPTPNLRGTAIWTDDFSDPSTWETFYGETHSSPPGAPEVEWVITTDSMAAPWAALNPMMLPTADNGFGFIDGDAGLDGSVQDAYLYTANPIDLSGIENVALEFSYVTRNFGTTYSVVYSLDAGETWTSVPVPGTPGVNEDSSNPAFTIVDLSAQIGNQPQVWVGFRYQANWGWFWAVDDVALVETPDNYLSLRRATFDKWITLYSGADGFLGPDIDVVQSYEYGHYSADQVRPLSFTADVQNFGTQPQTNVTFNVTLTDPEGTPHSFSAVRDVIEPGERTFIIIEDAMPTPFNLDDSEGAMVGEYTVSFSIEQEEEEFFPEDNVVSDKRFFVDPEFMGQDRAASFGVFAGLQSWDYTGVTRYAFHEEAEIDFIEFALSAGEGSSSNAEFASIGLNVATGSYFGGQDAPNDEINDFHLTPGGEPLWTEFIVDTTVFNPSPVAAADVQWVRVMMDEPIIVDPALIYNAEITIGGLPEEGLSQFIYILAGGGTPSLSTIFFGLDVDGGAVNSALGSGFAIRLGSSDPTFNVEGTPPVTFRLGQNYPNPTNGQETLIDWELFEPAKNITFTVHDMNGRVVDQRKLGDRPSGTQETIRLNSNLAAGVYQYSLIVGNYRAVRKMVVTK